MEIEREILEEDEQKQLTRSLFPVELSGQSLAGASEQGTRAFNHTREPDYKLD